jgi:HAE1 family hydrophobic/amphiphilic exporter-1
MTTLAAAAGAVPIAVGVGADGASRRALGLVIVGGLLVSQLITLFVTPVLYLYLERFQSAVLDRTSFFRSTHRRGPAGLDGRAVGRRVPVAGGSEPEETGPRA